MQYSIDAPLELVYIYYQILRRNKLVYSYLIGCYLLLTISKYLYNYIIHNSDELVCYIDYVYIYESLIFLYLHFTLRYQYLLDITAVDYYERKYRFQIDYNVISDTNIYRVHVKTALIEGIHIHSVNELFIGACWYEREIWDFFGIVFTHNTDLRRLLTDYAFEGYPLKKDFPLSGFVEVRYSDFIKRLDYAEIRSIQEYKVFELSNPWSRTIPSKFKDLFHLYRNLKNKPIHIEHLAPIEILSS